VLIALQSLKREKWAHKTPLHISRRNVATQLARLYFDTAIAGTAASLGQLLELTKPDHIVFGTDFPPASERVIDQNIAARGALTCMSEVEKSPINQTHGASFGGLRLKCPATSRRPRGLSRPLPDFGRRNLNLQILLFENRTRTHQRSLPRSSVERRINNRARFLGV